MTYEIEVIEDSEWMDEFIKIGTSESVRINNKFVKEVWQDLQKIKEEKGE